MPPTIIISIGPRLPMNPNSRLLILDPFTFAATSGESRAVVLHVNVVVDPLHTLDVRPRRAVIAPQDAEGGVGDPGRVAHDEQRPGVPPVEGGLQVEVEQVRPGQFDPYRPRRRTRDLAIADKAAALAELDTLQAETAKKTRGLFSPQKIVECVRAAVELPFDEGLAKERALFVECLNSPQRAGLVHAFFAERETAKVPEAQGAAPRALGADSRRIRRLVLGSSMGLVLLGAAIGIGGAFVASRWIQSQLFGVTVTDPITIVLVTVAVVVTALFATWHPAR